MQEVISVEKEGDVDKRRSDRLSSANIVSTKSSLYLGLGTLTKFLNKLTNLFEASKTIISSQLRRAL